MAESIQYYIRRVGDNARAAARDMGRAETAAKNAALIAIAEALEAGAASLIAENRKDLDAGLERGLDSAMLERLDIDEKRVKAIA